MRLTPVLRSEALLSMLANTPARSGPARRNASRQAVAARMGCDESQMLPSARGSSKEIGSRKRARRKSMSALSVRSEEHTSELQSRGHLVCRLLLEKKKITNKRT